jgi:hypothetical protein
MDEYIKLEDCIIGHLYKVQARNINLAVYNGEGGFIGIRTKFGSSYLDTEMHWDTGAPFGTAHPLEDLGQIPDDIEAVESFLNEEAVHGEMPYKHNEKLFNYLLARELTEYRDHGDA